MPMPKKKKPSVFLLENPLDVLGGDDDEGLDPQEETSLEKRRHDAVNRKNQLAKWEKDLQNRERRIKEDRLTSKSIERKSALKQQLEGSLPDRPVDLTLEQVTEKYGPLQHMPDEFHPIYVEKWATFLPNLARRENFSLAHLELLKVLCDAYVQLDEVRGFLKKNGYTYKSFSQGGEAKWIQFPQVGIASRLRQEVIRITSNLNLFPKKDKGKTKDTGEAESREWD